MRLHLTEWFLHIPRALRSTRCAHHDKGRKVHTAIADARAHYQALVQHGLDSLAAAEGCRWEIQSASLQRVELITIELADLPADRLLQAVLDERGHRPFLPWRADETRQAWAQSRRVLEYWHAGQADPRPKSVRLAG